MQILQNVNVFFISFPGARVLFGSILLSETNSSAPRKNSSDFKSVISDHGVWIEFMISSYLIAF